jgi:very-short-patch-repair endonuclease
MSTGIYTRTKEMKKNISKGRKEYLKTHIHPMEGKHHTEQSKRKNSESHKGKSYPNISKGLFGHLVSEETIKKMRAAAIIRMERQLREGKVKWMDTDIEMLMYEGLLSEGYLIAKQYYIKGVGRVDFYLPEFDIVIECDGDYWHSLPEKKEKDYIRNERLKKLGYIVLRFLGSEIKKNLKKCLNSTKEEIQNG